jgi:UPF0755 protein
MDTNTQSDTFFSDQYARRRFPPLLSWSGFSVFVIVSAVVLLWFLAWRPPSNSPSGFFLAVPKGATLSETAAQLEEQLLIRSPFWFKVFGTLFDGKHGVKAGDYFLSKPLAVVPLAWRLTHGTYRLTPVRITIPEGTNNRQMALLLAKALPRFSTPRFLELAKDREGYLFPDTYDFLPNADERVVIAALTAAFEKRLAPLQERISGFGRPLADIVNMAALLEEEARTEETRRTVAGILWKRLDKGMLLQVDAVFPYIFGDRPYDLTDGDLLVDSRYNTYKYLGLPPTAISNPGFSAILAAMMPIETSYFYYLSDKEGNMHYAATHDEHLANRRQYLGQNH